MKKKKTWETVPGGNERAKAHHKRIMRRQYKHLSIMLAILIPIIVFKHVFGLNKPPAPVVEEVSPSMETARLLELINKKNPEGRGIIGKNDMVAVGLDDFPWVNIIATRSRESRKAFSVGTAVRLRDSAASQDYLITATHLFIDRRTKEVRKGEILYFGIPGSSFGDGEHFILDMEQVGANDYGENDIMIIQIPHAPHLAAIEIKAESFIAEPSGESFNVEVVSALSFSQEGVFKVQQLAEAEMHSINVEKDTLITSADAFKGVSGSLVFTKIKGKRKFLGIMSRATLTPKCSGYKEGQRCFNLIAVVNFDLIQKERELRTAPLKRFID
jgi:hypothetical protein